MQISEIDAGLAKRLSATKLSERSIYERIFLAACCGARLVKWTGPLDIGQLQRISFRGFKVQSDLGTPATYTISW